MKCKTCEDTGKCCGAPDCKGKCPDCYCAECTFAPCQCLPAECEHRWIEDDDVRVCKDCGESEEWEENQWMPVEGDEA